MIVTSLDLEMNQPSGSIIQIGACTADLLTGEIIEKLSVYVNCSETLNPLIITLTGITQNQVDTGLNLWDAYLLLREMHISSKALLNPLTWGGGDSALLREQLVTKYPNQDIQWCFGRRWLDAKTVHQFVQMTKGKKIQAGLAKALTRYGLAFQGRKHNALDDAINTVRVVRAALNLQ